MIGVTNGEHGSPRPLAQVQSCRTESFPLLFVTRYCGVELSSVAAAVHEGLGVLDAHLKHLRVAIPRDVVVIFRNHMSDSVTVDIGYVVPLETVAQAAGEIHSGWSPGGPMLWYLPHEGVRGVFEAYEELRRVAESQGLSLSSTVWQRFDSRALHGQPILPRARAYVPLAHPAHPAATI